MSGEKLFKRVARGLSSTGRALPLHTQSLTSIMHNQMVVLECFYCFEANITVLCPAIHAQITDFNFLSYTLAGCVVHFLNYSALEFLKSDHPAWNKVHADSICSFKKNDYLEQFSVHVSFVYSQKTF